MKKKLLRYPYGSYQVTSRTGNGQIMWAARGYAWFSLSGNFYGYSIMTWNYDPIMRMQRMRREKV